MTNKYKALLQKFIKTREGGKAIETVERSWGLTETYIVTLTYIERQLIEDLIKEKL